MRVNLVHGFAGCNRVVNAFDWGACGLVAYAAHHSVVIYDVEGCKILTRLIGHVGRVNCVRWLGAGVSQEEFLASGAADNRIIVWKIYLQRREQPWEAAAVLEAHTLAVTGMATHRLNDGYLLLVSTSGDDQVIVWSNDAQEASTGHPGSFSQGHWRVRQLIKLPLRLQHSVSLAQLPGLPDWSLLALGGVDNSIRVLAASGRGEFRQVCRLLGHGNWVRSLAFTLSRDSGGERLLLASASQDKYIRIWAIQAHASPAKDNAPSEFPTAASLSRYAPKTELQAGGRTFRISLEALLMGHEDWVHTVCWQPAGKLADPRRACLLSASMDRTMALWRKDVASGLWMSEESVGDAGPSNLGYFGGAWSPSGDAIIAHGYTGALHLWRRRDGDSSGWSPHSALGGHFGPVVDLAWAFNGKCLLSISTDQTARITAASQSGAWMEIARPQVHGHDFSCAAALPAGSGGAFMYASGSEEKVIRILEAPEAFLDTLAFVRGERAVPPSASPQEERALGAAVPALGLSNKAVYSSDEIAERDGPDLAPRAEPGAVSGRPLEEHLQQSTLWPEVYKAYGHGNELYCMAADPRGALMASACRAQARDTAAIWIWKVGSWAPWQQLEAHTLTVTQLAFTYDGSRLISVSRDRSIAVWRRSDDESAPLKLVGRVQKAHARVIWAVACSADGSFFATGARDNTVKLWAIPKTDAEGLPTEPAATLPPFAASIHSLAFTTRSGESLLSDAGNARVQQHVLAVGLEDGGVQLFSISVGSDDDGKLRMGEQKCAWQSPPHLSHSGAIRRLCWREVDGGGSCGTRLLASAGDDHAVTVLEVSLVER